MEEEEVSFDKLIFKGVDNLLTRICGAGMLKRTVKGFTASSTTQSMYLGRSSDSRPETERSSEEYKTKHANMKALPKKLNSIC